MCDRGCGDALSRISQRYATTYLTRVPYAKARCHVPKRLQAPFAQIPASAQQVLLGHLTDKDLAKLTLVKKSSLDEDCCYSQQRFAKVDKAILVFNDLEATVQSLVDVKIKLTRSRTRGEKAALLTEFHRLECLLARYKTYEICMCLTSVLKLCYGMCFRQQYSLQFNQVLGLLYNTSVDAEDEFPEWVWNQVHKARRMIGNADTKLWVY